MLVPIALASILTAALTVLVGMPFNYANIIALPLLGRHRRRQRHPCRASHAHRGRGAAVQHEHDARRARERAHDRRELRQPRVLVARRHGEHGHSAGARVGGEHDGDADRAAGVAEGVAAEADGRAHDARARHGRERFLGLGRRARAARGRHAPCAPSCGPAATGATSPVSTSRSPTGDLTERDSLHRAAAGCAAVFHVAADYRLWVADSGADVSRERRRARSTCSRPRRPAGATRLVYTSSVAVLGINRDRTPADEDTPVTVADMVGPLQALEISGRAGRAPARERARLPRRDRQPVDADRSARHQADADGPHPARRRRGPHAGVRRHGLEPRARRRRRAGAPRGVEASARPASATSWAATISRCSRFSSSSPSTSAGERVRFACRIGRSIRSRSRRKVGARSRKREPRVTLDGVRMSTKHMYFSSRKAQRELGYAGAIRASRIAAAIDWFKANDYF